LTVKSALLSAVTANAVAPANVAARSSVTWTADSATSPRFSTRSV